MPCRKELSLWADCSVICLLWSSPHLHLCKGLFDKKENKLKKSGLGSTEVPEWMKSWATGQNFRHSEAGEGAAVHVGRAVLPAAVPPGALLSWIWKGEGKLRCLKGKVLFWTCLDVDVNLPCFVMNTWVSGRFSSPIVSATNLHWPRAAFPSTYISYRRIYFKAQASCIQAKWSYCHLGSN